MAYELTNSEKDIEMLIILKAYSMIVIITFFKLQFHENEK